MKILIGDDHQLFREGLRRLLEQLNAEAAFVDASTFSEILEFSQGAQKFDLILIDLQMPGWSGFSGIRQVREAQPGTPIVVVSASENHADVRNALEHGASGYIPKSSSVKVMLSALNLVFSGGIYVPPAVMQPMGEAHAARIAGGAAHPLTVDRPATHALTQRQWDVLNCLREGKSNKQIAYELGLSEGTVKIHVTAIFKSLGVKNRTQAVIAASEMQR